MMVKGSQSSQRLIMEKSFYDLSTKKWIKREKLYVSSDRTGIDKDSQDCEYLVMEKSFFDLESKKWLVQEKTKLSTENNASRVIQIPFRRGGTVSFYPNYLQHDTQQSILDELYNNNRFRQYRIQGEFEPRVHFLVHEDATDNFDHEQPGYKYGTIHMKGVPPGQFPTLIELSERAKLTCDVSKWKIGINPIVYRAGNDRIGGHADNDQGESCIFAVILSGEKCRPVHIYPNNKKCQLEHGDERIILYAQTGDAYQMDGKLQENYFHCVKRDKPENHNQRVVIIFRDGRKVLLRRDTGQPVTDFKPRIPDSVRFGSLIPGLIEGHLYSRHELLTQSFHYGRQRGISGNRRDGCDAIIVSGMSEPMQDEFHTFFYSATAKVGGEALLFSSENQIRVRVFRSSSYEHDLRAKRPALSTAYRYDGVYRVQLFRRPGKCEGSPFVFVLSRCEKGTNSTTNRLSSNEFLLQFLPEFNATSTGTAPSCTDSLQDVLSLTKTMTTKRVPCHKFTARDDRRSCSRKRKCPVNS